LQSQQPLGAEYELRRPHFRQTATEPEHPREPWASRARRVVRETARSPLRRRRASEPAADLPGAEQAEPT
jgi:hypothetical protein